MPVFKKSSEIPVSAEQLFEWHCRPGAFERLAPPWEQIELLSSEGVQDGGVAEILADRPDDIPGLVELRVREEPLDRPY